MKNGENPTAKNSLAKDLRFTPTAPKVRRMVTECGARDLPIDRLPEESVKSRIERKLVQIQKLLKEL